MARGRDAADVPISNTFGSNVMKYFKVWSDEVSEEISWFNGAGVITGSERTTLTLIILPATC
jgi:hypothetical protein